MGDKDKLMPEKQAQYFFKQMIAAVDYCHSCGVCHRDLKLENIVLASKNKKHSLIKVTDFGESKDSSHSLPKTNVSAVKDFCVVVYVKVLRPYFRWLHPHASCVIYSLYPQTLVAPQAATTTANRWRSTWWYYYVTQYGTCNVTAAVVWPTQVGTISYMAPVIFVCPSRATGLECDRDTVLLSCAKFQANLAHGARVSARTVNACVNHSTGWLLQEVTMAGKLPATTSTSSDGAASYGAATTLSYNGALVDT